MAVAISNIVVLGNCSCLPLIPLSDVKGFQNAGKGKTDRASILYFYKSHKFIMNGAKSYDEIPEFFKKLFGASEKVQSYEIVNISAVYNFCNVIILPILYAKLMETVSLGAYLLFEQERFSAIVWKKDRHRSETANIFHTGKVCLTGFRTLDSLYSYVDALKKYVY